MNRVILFTAVCLIGCGKSDSAYREALQTLNAEEQILERDRAAYKEIDEILAKGKAERAELAKFAGGDLEVAKLSADADIKDAKDYDRVKAKIDAKVAKQQAVVDKARSDLERVRPK